MSDAKQLIEIIDDNNDFLEIFSTKLKGSGFDVVTASNGEEGIAIARDRRPDIILLDVQMPDLNGIETLSRLKSEPSTANIRVIFLTNYGEPQKETTWIDEKFAREAGALDYIKKSEELDVIVKEVKRIISSVSHT